MKNHLLSAVVGTALAVSAGAVEVQLCAGGSLAVGDMKLLPVIHGEAWRETAEGPAHLFPSPEGTLSFDMKPSCRQSPWARASASLLPVANGRALYSATLTSLEDQKPEVIDLEVRLPVQSIVEGTWELSTGAKGRFPKTLDRRNIGLFSGKVSWVRLTPKGGEPLTLSFPAPVHVTAQDDRIWVPTFSLRIAPMAGPGSGTFPKGGVCAFQCLLAAPGGVKTRVAKPVVIKAGPDWAPIDYIKDIEKGSALDFSNQGLQDAPAGKYGYLRNAGGHFVFEKRPDKPVRLYGVNLCFEANFPEKDEADALITRLVRLGYNTIRVHHYESTEGVVKGSPDHLAINAEHTRKLDYLLSRAMAAGLYITTDLYTCRSVRWDEIGLERPAWSHSDLVDNQVYKNLIAVHEPAFQNWKRFATNFLTHVNPYTGRRYADEPGLPLVSLINEGHLSWCWDRIVTLAPMKRAWKAWLAKRRAANPAYAPGVSDDCEQARDTSAATFGDFMADLEAALVQRERAAMREIGLKALLTSQNCGWHSLAMEGVREKHYDYVDDHFYVDHPEFLERAWCLPSRCANRNPALEGHLPPENIAFTRLADKPFTVTEWNFSGPGMFRGVGGIMTGAMGALQDWDGLWRFAYSHSLWGMRTRAGTPGYFDIASDPLSQASDRASVCLFLRRDLEPLADNVALVYTPGDFNVGGRWREAVPKNRAEAWNVRVATSVGGGTAGWNVAPGVSRGRGSVPPPPAPRTATPEPRIVRDTERGSFAINTPRTAGGFVPSGSLAAGAVRFDVGAVAATVWASSLDGEPIPRSRRLLVTHLTDVQADGCTYADTAKRVLLKGGAYPPLARIGTAKVEIALERPEGYAVWALATSGKRLHRVPAEVKAGRLVFTARTASPSTAILLYEVVK